MRLVLSIAIGIFSLALLAGTSGCQKKTENNGTETTPENPPNTVDMHPTEGPHKGGLVELGNEEYHGEVVHDDEKGTVTIYILDSAAKKQVPIEAAEVVINVKHGKKAEQFKLKASADKGDPQGKSSRFVSSEKELAKDLDAEGVEAHLVVTIMEKSYQGKIQHDHDHDH